MRACTALGAPGRPTRTQGLRAAVSACACVRACRASQFIGFAIPARPLLAQTGVDGTREARLGNVGLIVLDEVHYLGDPNRGSVWEEVIINCPKHIQLLAMSATVRNPEDLGDWISKVGRVDGVGDDCGVRHTGQEGIFMRKCLWWRL
jgi:hypothetical protein